MDYRTRAVIERSAEGVEELRNLVAALTDRVEALEGELQRRRGGRPRKQENGEAPATHQR